MGDENSHRGAVAAVVLTHDAPDAVARCLGALAAQTVPLAAVLVTDNASDPPIRGVEAHHPHATVQRLDHNGGPAGGYAEALRAFLATDFEWAWVMDDDCVPAPEALATQLRDARDDRVVLAAVVADDSGEVSRGHGWWGALIHRSVIERVGVPNADLFWWTEDTEYLQWRIPEAGFDVVWTEGPVMHVSRGRDDAAKPAWKYYYEARNQVYHRLYVQRPTTSPAPYHLKVRVRAGRAARSVGKLVVRAAVREQDDRARKLAYTGRGVWDGLRRHLGATVAVDDADRPSATALVRGAA